MIGRKRARRIGLSTGATWVVTDRREHGVGRGETDEPSEIDAARESG